VQQVENDRHFNTATLVFGACEEQEVRLNIDAAFMAFAVMQLPFDTFCQ
jgi:hypothetical protein